MNSDQALQGELEADITTPLLIKAIPKDRRLSEDEAHGHEPDWPGQADFEGLPWWKKPSIYWLLPPFLLFTLAFGGLIVPKITLIQDLICRDYLAERTSLDPDYTYLPIIFGERNDQCSIPAVESRTAVFAMIGGSVAGILTAFTSPWLGTLSDRYGRLPLIVITSCGPLIGEVVTIIAASHPDKFVVNWLYVGFVADGLSGSFIASMALSHSYASDCTPPARRNVAFGFFHGVLFTGIALGPLVAGLIIKATGSLLSIFYMALAFHLFFIACLASVIPESLSKRRQKLARDKHEKELQIKKAKNPDATWLTGVRTFNLFEPLKILYPKGPGSSPRLRRNLILLAATDTLLFGVSMGSMTVVLIYSRRAFEWSPADQSFFMSAANVCRVLCLFVLLPMITRVARGAVSGRKHHKQTGADSLDLWLLRGAIVFEVIGYLGYGTVRTSGLFVLSGCLASVGGIGSPSLQSVMSKSVPPDQTGKLLGAVSLLHALARVAAPLVFNGIFALTTGSKFPSAVFICLAGAFATASILSIFLKPGVYLDEEDEQQSTEEEPPHANMAAADADI